MVLVELAGLPLTGDAVGEHPAGGVVTEPDQRAEVGRLGEPEAKIVHAGIVAWGARSGPVIGSGDRVR
ncbi:hypothetical protein [Streptomyces sp. KAU_LT]|uniref:hypothetical protein n=1 Tax=Streptomyces sp. KAU_LT TaxID=3046669 RepID=UPI0024B7742E|nr:hypothetical protein [Streptomyces sp. KAU_LT]MDI9835186.1 hypothetical protein [Streptomyces sp. KAU_LT]